MAKIYADLIMKQAICSKTGQPWTIEDVPEKVRAAVAALLPEEGEAFVVEEQGE